MLIKQSLRKGFFFFFFLAVRKKSRIFYMVWLTIEVVINILYIHME